MSRYTSSQPDRWNSPRPYSDPSLRRYHYGDIQPMLQARKPLLARLLGK